MDTDVREDVYFNVDEVSIFRELLISFLQYLGSYLIHYYLSTVIKREQFYLL